jgi:hypothetical protein
MFMDSKDKAGTWLFCTLFIAISFGYIGYWWADSYKHQKAFENGYEQKVEKVTFGPDVIIWVKRDSQVKLEGK